MEATSSDQPTVFTELRRRRAELLESIHALEQALAAPAPGREVAWRARVKSSVRRLAEDFATHKAMTEGADGLYGELRAAAPRLAGAVDRLVREHAAILDQITELLARVRSSDVVAVDVHAVRECGTAVVVTLLRHRQRGSDLIYEAYEFDIGGET